MGQARRYRQGKVKGGERPLTTQAGTVANLQQIDTAGLGSERFSLRGVSGVEYPRNTSRVATGHARACAVGERLVCCNINGG
jgi:hypothetical protein